MGTLNFSVGRGNKSKGTGSPTMRSSHLKTANAFSTTTAAANVEDASGDIELAAGDVLFCHATVAQRLVFGGGTATATVGHYLKADQEYVFEIEQSDAGTTSVRDVA